LVVVPGAAYVVLNPLRFNPLQDDIERAVWPINPVRRVVGVVLAGRVIVTTISPIGADLGFLVDRWIVLPAGR